LALTSFLRKAQMLEHKNDRKSLQKLVARFQDKSIQRAIDTAEVEVCQKAESSGAIQVKNATVVWHEPQSLHIALLSETAESTSQRGTRVQRAACASYPYAAAFFP
jgi:hypothetical protein